MLNPEKIAFTWSGRSFHHEKLHPELGCTLDVDCHTSCSHNSHFSINSFHKKFPKTSVFSWMHHMLWKNVSYEFGPHKRHYWLILKMSYWRIVQISSCHYYVWYARIKRRKMNNFSSWSITKWKTKGTFSVPTRMVNYIIYKQFHYLMICTYLRVMFKKQQEKKMYKGKCREVKESYHRTLCFVNFHENLIYLKI